MPNLQREFAGKIDYAQFLHDGSEIRFRENSDGNEKFLILGIKSECRIAVIEVMLK